MLLGDGTSWSCLHGVRRWRENCGCQTGGQDGWSQQWRTPLREALDWLRDDLAIFCEEKSRSLVKDFWQARDEFIDLILDPSDNQQNRFFEKHQVDTLSAKQKALILKLLELQHYAMKMYTSCGWFFSDLSGIETVQILKYAARAIEISNEIQPNSFEAHFLHLLEKANSNVAEYGNGKQLYEKFVMIEAT